MDSSSEEEESKKGGERKHVNKGALSEEKLSNKRQYKEARKKIKMGKRKGVMDKQMQQNTAAAAQQSKK